MGAQTRADIFYLTDVTDKRDQPWQTLKPSVSGSTSQLTNNNTRPAFCVATIIIITPLILLTPHIGAGSDLTKILTPRLIKILIKPMTGVPGQSLDINHPCHEYEHSSI